MMVCIHTSSLFVTNNDVGSNTPLGGANGSAELGSSHMTSSEFIPEIIIRIGQKKHNNSKKYTIIKSAQEIEEDDGGRYWQHFCGITNQEACLTLFGV